MSVVLLVCEVPRVGGNPTTQKERQSSRGSPLNPAKESEFAHFKKNKNKIPIAGRAKTKEIQLKGRLDTVFIRSWLQRY